MVKRAPVNVRYLWLFGEHILTRSFTARDPFETFGERNEDAPLEVRGRLSCRRATIGRTVIERQKSPTGPQRESHPISSRSDRQR
jgi:hypothetical protein